MSLSDRIWSPGVDLGLPQHLRISLCSPETRELSSTAVKTNINNVREPKMAEEKMDLILQIKEQNVSN